MSQWTCEECGRRFRRTNQRHTCSRVTVDDVFGGASPHSHAMFEAFRAIVDSVGPYELSITKSGVGFKGTHRVFAAVRPTKTGLGGFLDLTHHVEDERFSTVEPYTKRLFIHKLRLTSVDQLDHDFRHWVENAYQVGAGQHLKGEPIR